MNKLILVPLLLLVTSCGMFFQQPKKIKAGYFPPDQQMVNGHQLSVRAYVERFYQVANKYGHNFGYGNLSVRFNSSVGREGAQAWIANYSGVYLIEIDPDYWNSPHTSNADREMTMFHEMAHGYLGRKNHIDDLYSINFADQAPVSIMHSSAFNPNTYSNNLDYYWDELFANIKNFDNFRFINGYNFDDTYYANYDIKIFNQAQTGRAIASIEVGQNEEEFFDKETLENLEPIICSDTQTVQKELLKKLKR